MLLEIMGEPQKEEEWKVWFFGGGWEADFYFKLPDKFAVSWSQYSWAMTNSACLLEFNKEL